MLFLLFSICKSPDGIGMETHLIVKSRTFFPLVSIVVPHCNVVKLKRKMYQSDNHVSSLDEYITIEEDKNRG